MARELFEIEKGLSIVTENTDSGVSILTGAGVPDGLGDQATAPIGSLYLRQGTGELYQKIASVGAAADYERIQTGSQLTFRPEVVAVLTDDTQAAGTRDVVVSPFSDDESGLGPSDFPVGQYLISGAATTPVLLEITNVTGDDVTFSSATSLVDGDAFVVKKYLPDSPGSLENEALVVFSGGVMVKIADIDFAFATGINLSSGYSPVNGDPAAGDSVELAIGKLDGNQDDLQLLQGVSQGSTDLGTFTGTTITDGQTVKSALQELETAYEETDANVDDLITLSGVAENSTDLGTFTGDVVQDNQDVKEAIQDLDTEATRNRGKATSAGVTTATVIDSVLVDEVAQAVWNITIEDAANPARKRSIILHAAHDGHASADATDIDDSSFAQLRLGPNFNRSVSVTLSGTGAAQVMQLTVASTEPSGVNVYAKRVETLF